MGICGTGQDPGIGTDSMDRVGPYARANLDRKWLGFCSSLLVESARDLARVMNVNSRATAITMWINY